MNFLSILWARSGSPWHVALLAWATGVDGICPQRQLRVGHELVGLSVMFLGVEAEQLDHNYS
jgi:hypothetical protein